MDNSVKKWLVRAGSLFILFGFFIPSMAVSCSAFGVTQEQSFSMNDAASQMDQGILYLVLIGIFATIVLSFLIARNNQQKVFFILGEAVGLGLGIFSILVSLISLSSQIGELAQIGVDFKVKPGFFLLIFGYGLAGFGVIIDFLESSRRSVSFQHSPQQNYTPISPPVADYAAPPPMYAGSSSGPRLELVSGNAPGLVPITTPDFHIGRSSQNHCVVGDTQVSRTHVRIREAQDTWFIQDQNSSSGTFVNGSQIQAQRLNDGDQIHIGQTTFRFRA
jgi:hypothetical protein